VWFWYTKSRTVNESRPALSRLSFMRVRFLQYAPYHRKIPPWSTALFSSPSAGRQRPASVPHARHFGEHIRLDAAVVADRHRWVFELLYQIVRQAFTIAVPKQSSTNESSDKTFENSPFIPKQLFPRYLMKIILPAKLISAGRHNHFLRM
jgi:hypothetical protein